MWARFLALVVVAGFARALGQQNTATVQEIIDTCYDFLNEHLCQGEKWGKPFHFFKPSSEKYSSSQWHWDSGAHMITWSRRNVTNSVLDLRTMLSMQLPDGRIPEEIFWQSTNKMQEEELKLQWSTDQYTDIVQMPVIPFSLRAIYEARPDVALLKEFLPPIVNYFKWWRKQRDLGDGLVVIIHGWESGLDASPTYDPAYGVYVTDLSKVAFAELYPRFDELIEWYKGRLHWDIAKILAEAVPTKPVSEQSSASASGSGRALGAVSTRFFVKDVGVNAVYAAGWKVLSQLAALVPDDPSFAAMSADCAAEAKTSTQAIVSKMFDAKRGEYRSLWIDGDKQERRTDANTIQNLLPLMMGDLPAEHVDMIVAQLQDETKFNLPFGLPTVAKNDPQFCADFPVDLMWRGPVWPMMNWMVTEGLILHGRQDVAQALLDKTIALYQKSGVWEHYNPITGAAYGAVGLGMSTLIVDMLYRLGRV